MTRFFALIFAFLALVGAGDSPAAQPSDIPMSLPLNLPRSGPPDLKVGAAWAVRDGAAAIEAASKFMGVVLDGASAELRGSADAALVTDTPVTDSNPVWVVKTKPVAFTIGTVELAPDKLTDVSSDPFSFELLVRAQDGMVLRAQTPAATCKGMKGHIESLDAATFRTELGRNCRMTLADARSKPTLTLAQALRLSEEGTGGVGGAQQLVIYYLRWSEPDCVNKVPKDSWIIDARSDASDGSMTAGMEARLPEADRPLVSNLVSIVIDEPKKWYRSGNFPKPLIRSDVDGTILYPGDSGKKKGDK